MKKLFTFIAIILLSGSTSISYAQLLSLPTGNSSYSIHPGYMDNSGRLLTVILNNPYSGDTNRYILGIRFDKQKLYVDTLVTTQRLFFNKGGSPRLVFAGKQTLLLFDILNHTFYETNFKYGIRRMAELDNDQVVIVADDRGEDFTKATSLNPPQAIYIYGMYGFNLKYYTLIKPNVGLFYIDGLLAMKNSFCVIVNTSLAINATIKHNPFSVVDPVEQFWDLKYYNLSGQYLKNQKIEADKIYPDKQGDKFLSNTDDRLDIWSYNPQIEEYENIKSINMKRNKLVDYVFDNDFLYYLFVNSDTSKTYFRRIALKGDDDKQVEVPGFKDISYTSGKVTLGYHLSNHHDKRVYKKAKKVFGLDSQRKYTYYKIAVHSAPLNLTIPVESIFSMKIDNSPKAYKLNFRDSFNTLGLTFIPCQLMDYNLNSFIAYKRDYIRETSIRGITISAGEFCFFYLDEKKQLWNSHDEKLVENITDIESAVEYSVDYFLKNSKIFNIYGI